MEFSTWESLLLGIMAIAVIFWMKPGIKNSMKIGRAAKSDWMGLLLPIAFVVMFIIFLIAMV